MTQKAKNYWLMKSEPDVYSYDDLVKKGSGMWDGVRNYAAAKHMRAMEKGDLCFFYHSNIGVEIVAIMEIAREYYPDPTDEKGKFVAVDVKPVRKLKNSVSLKSIKANPKLADMVMLRQSRLSVAPIAQDEWEEILRISGE
ncbi:ubiquinol-cytochrome C reductase [Sphingorhabdus lutea]|uniref:Ubiquinol-cytochrome C reductase n=1 Tax=Sphingorhabdus lutea TaxID=1913578 RepID=A0A1L3J9U7_9SPHN|nr:EVE domain-containing protein [Sphingorhabdus lutea]APG61906.1 ubiquinol-cytochrome C reductase [Sphingorhabdus lutea]